MADSASPISSSKAVCHWSGDSTTPSIVLNNPAYTLRIERTLSSRTELGTSGRSRPYITTSGSELNGTVLVLVPYCTVLMENSWRTRGASGECHRRLRPVRPVRPVRPPAAGDHPGGHRGVPPARLRRCDHRRGRRTRVSLQADPLQALRRQAAAVRRG